MSVVYTCSRIAVNLTQSYSPLYLTEALHFQIVSKHFAGSSCFNILPRSKISAFDVIFVALGAYIYLMLFIYLFIYLFVCVSVSFLKSWLTKYSVAHTCNPYNLATNPASLFMIFTPISFSWLSYSLVLGS